MNRAPDLWQGVRIQEWRARWGVPILRILPSTGSTNDVARDLAERGVPPFTTVIADVQTAGRGRLGRAWVAPAGAALLISVVFRPPARRGTAAHGTSPLRIGLALAAALETLGYPRTRLKWPNDLVAPDGRKLAGILCEAAFERGAPDYVIAGLGINLTQRREQWPPALRDTATSILEAFGTRLDRVTLAGALLDALRESAPRLGQTLAAHELRAYAARDALAGAPITVDGRNAGTALGIDADGALRLRTQRGIERVLRGTVRVAPQHPPDAAAAVSEPHPFKATATTTSNPRAQ